MMELLFTLINVAVIPAWVLIAFFPKSKWTSKWVYSYAWHMLLAIFYTVFILWGFIENIGSQGGMDSLAALRIGFENDKVLLAAWAHYLVFDLFVGTYIAKDAQQRNSITLVLKPILLLTLMLGPIGFLAYQIHVKIKKNDISE